MATGVVTCSRCGAVSALSARFCASCAAPLGSPEPIGEVRKTVTAVFCDVTGSTGLARRLDPEVMRAVMEQYFAAVSAVLARHGGTVEKFVGDAVMAVFGVPVAHDDDALRACRAAIEILAAVGVVDARVESGHGVQFGVRIGLETGEVVVGDASRGSTFASGAAVNTAARLEQAARPRECLVGPECYRLVRDHVMVEDRVALALKGIEGTIDAFSLLGLREPDGERPATTALVGRSRELALLAQAFDRAASDRTCQLATVLGPAGMGKSRLAAEFMASVAAKATVLRGRCVSYGEGVTYWPLVEAVRQAADLSGAETQHQARAALAQLLADVPDAPEVMERIAPVAGLGGAPGPPDDTAWAVQRLLEVLAERRPVVLVVDDLHWAEPGLVDLVEGVCDWSRDAPILVAVFARPEFLDDHPGWGAGRMNAVTALLEPLRDDEVDALTSGLLGGVLADAAADRLREAAGGNPLFVEQLLAMLVEDGVLRLDGPRWLLTDAVTQVQIPPTISALLTARLDRLSAEERAVLGSASVIGQVFYRAALSELSTVPADQVSALLKSLVRKGLVRPTRSDLSGQDALRFGHVLIRDAAYQALPKSMRADLHERFARWLDEHYEGQAVDDFIGSHLESAYHLRAELGELDEGSRRLGREAAQRLSAAGELLLFADDGAAIALLERAERLRDDDGPDRWALQIELARAWWRNSTRLDEAAALSHQVLRSAQAAGDEGWSALARLVAASVRLSTEPAGATEVLRRECLASLQIFAAEEDHYGISVAHISLSDVANMAARTAEELRHITLAAEHAELAGRHREAQRYRLVALTMLMSGDCPAERGLAESRREFQQADHRSGRALTASHVSFFATLLGEEQEANQARELAEQLGVELHGDEATTITWVTSLAQLFVGNWPAAARLFAEVCASREASGDLAVLSTDAALHAHALLHMGQVDLARGRLAMSHRIGADDDVWTQALVHAGRGWLAALDNDGDGSRQDLAVAISLVPDDVLPVLALIHEACAEAAAVLGEPSLAHEHRQKALDLHRAKGNVVSTARLQSLL